MNTVFLKTGDTLESAVSQLPSGGVIVLTERISAEHARLPAHSGIITVTSLHDGCDYRENGAALVFDRSVTVTMGGETVFHDIRIELATTGVLAANFNPLDFDDGVEVIYDDSVDANGLYIVGGENNVDTNEGEYGKDTSLCIRSGEISRLVGFSRGCNGRIHTGHAFMEIGGDALVHYAVAGAMGEGAMAAGAEVRLSDNAVIEALHMGGAKDENLLTGDFEFFVCGGDLLRIERSSLISVKGKKRLTYDPEHAPDGLVFLAKLARFDEIKTTCDIHGHELGEPCKNPFDESGLIRTCKRCGHIELAGSVGAASGDNVLFVSDGGFGDGSLPAYPLGSYEEAQKKLRETGGVIVPVGKCTLSPNLLDPHGKAAPCYVEPIHKAEISVSSVYGGVDYRERGAHLHFAADMDYRMSGALRIENLDITASESAGFNNLVARYEPLYIGDNVTTPEFDGYELNVIGGYLGFSAQDLDRCEIPEEFDNVVCKARPLPENFEEKTELLPIEIAPKYSLRPKAAEAFNRMFRDMKEQGLKLPLVTDAMRSYDRQYMHYSNYVGRLRKTFGYGFEKAKSVVDRSCGRPCCSEHHYGVAVDMHDPDLTQFKKKHHYYDLTPEWAWVIENGPKYGIILRYPADKVDITGCIYEPWHFRYVGERAAYVISHRGITLEEYAGALYGAFELDSHVTVLSGSYNSITAFSLNTALIQLTGKHFITVGEKVKLKKPNDDASEC